MPKAPTRLAAVALVALTSATSALAEPTPAQIKEAAAAFDQGVQAAKAGDPEAAAVQFERADDVAPSDVALRAAIRARRDAKQLARAATLAALATTRHGDNAELVAFAREVMTAAAASTARVSVTCKPACELVVDRKIVHGVAQKEVTLFLEPGKHTVVAGWGDKTASKDVVAVSGESPKVGFLQPSDGAPPAASAAAVSSPASSAPSRPSRPPEDEGKGGLPPGVFYTGLALTGVLAGVSVWSGLDTKSNPGPDAVRSACVGQGTSCPEYQDGLSRQHRTNALLVGTGVVGVATVVVGAFFTGWGGASDAPAQGLRATPLVGLAPGGASLGATGSF